MASVINKRCVLSEVGNTGSVATVHRKNESQQQQRPRHLRCCIRDKENAVPLSDSTPDVGGDSARKRMKPGKCFFITVGFRQSVWSDTREQLVNNLKFGFQIEVISYASGLEKSDKSVTVDYHLHCFVEFAEPILIDEVRKYLVALYDEYYLNIQSCRSKRNALIYLSKEDVNVYTNLKTSVSF